MDEPIHPARAMTYEALLQGLSAACAAGLVYRRFRIDDGLALYCYTSRCVYDGGWNIFAMIARGLIIDERDRKIVATPFPKFFNVGERQVELPDLPFEVFDKLDGSLIIVFQHGGAWRCATKGAFDSSQAAWAQKRLDEADLSHLTPGTTYLMEAIYPENRIVVRYAEAELVMLAAYDEAGRECRYDRLADLCASAGWPIARRQTFASFEDMISHAEMLTLLEEGFVIRFEDGSRLKMKGAEYRRVHALISRCTPLAVWEAMIAGDDLGAIRRDLPEEFWTDFDQMVALLEGGLREIERELMALAESVSHLSDKSVGLSFKAMPPAVSPYLFAFRKAGTINAKTRANMLKALRPTANVLPGYEPSYTMDRVLREMDG